MGFQQRKSITFPRSISGANWVHFPIGSKLENVLAKTFLKTVLFQFNWNDALDGQGQMLYSYNHDH